MDKFDNKVDDDLMQKVDNILNGEKEENEVPELVFSEDVPKDYDISTDLNDGSIKEENVNAAQTVEGNFTPEVEIPNAGFDNNAPAAPDFGQIFQGEKPVQGTSAETTQWNSQQGNMQQGSGGTNAAWSAMKQDRMQDGDPNINSKATIGFVIGVIAMLLALFGLALGVVPVAIGLYFSITGMKSQKRKMAIAGTVMNVIGAILWIVAVFL